MREAFTCPSWPLLWPRIAPISVDVAKITHTFPLQHGRQGSNGKHAKGWSQGLHVKSEKLCGNVCIWVPLVRSRLSLVRHIGCHKQRRGSSAHRSNPTISHLRRNILDNTAFHLSGCSVPSEPTYLAAYLHT